MGGGGVYSGAESSVSVCRTVRQMSNVLHDLPQVLAQPRRSLKHSGGHEEQPSESELLRVERGEGRAEDLIRREQKERRKQREERRRRRRKRRAKNERKTRRRE